MSLNEVSAMVLPDASQVVVMSRDSVRLQGFRLGGVRRIIHRACRCFKICAADPTHSW